MRLFLIRHLPTLWNKKNVLQGSKDIPLAEISEDYKKEISNKKLLLNNYQFDEVLCSSLQRTKQTAYLYGYSPRIDSLLNELDFGPYEGKQKEELFQNHRNEWFTSPEKLVLGEALIDFEYRIKQFIHRYKKADQVLVFGHGSWIRALISIHETGNISKMNQVEVKNNQLLVLNVEESKHFV